MPTTREYEYLILPKGLEFTIMNPNWDGDNPDTHYYVDIRLEEEASCQLTGGTYEFTILKEIKE